MLNHIVLMGRMVADPELRRTGSGVAVASFRLAVEDDFKDKEGNKKTIFVDCTAWRGLGETVAKYFSKGRMAIVAGKLDIREWTDKDGNKRRSAEVVADNVYFGDSKKEESGGNSYGQQGGYSAPAYPATPASDFAMLDDDDAQLPF
jgi:single-strand DNA-binding protein